MFTKFRTSLRKFFFPPAGSPRRLLILPYALLGILSAIVLVGGAYGWAYTNSPSFCGTSCHTMPPEYAAYEASPHARVACVECHLGREFIGNQLFRKAGDIKHLVAMTFQTYTYPIMAESMRPAREICEQCHTPEKFSDDSLRIITHFKEDTQNTPSYTYLVLKTGGGDKRQGQALGIHWHIMNNVSYYSTDPLEQTIPYVQVTNDDGTVTKYVDVQSGLDPATIDPNKLKRVDCITCHNRITHRIYAPEDSVDLELSLGKISPTIPDIRKKAVEILRGNYTTQAEAQAGIAGVDAFYKANYPDFYAANQSKITDAVANLQTIYADSVFIDQKINWDTHPNNVGHIQSPGCFRCHDGKHLDANQNAIRMECNLCHSIPVVSSQQDYVTKIEISRGPEPTSHRSPNWISMHNKVFDASCSTCHNTKDAGATTNTSFCSNSACHGQTFKFAGFNAPKLREIIQAQLPTPMPTPIPAPTPAKGETPDFTKNILPLFGKCATCHNTTALTAGLDLSSYEGLMKGGKDGAVIIPNNSTTSLLLIKQSTQHFANFSADEMALMKQWIDAGAPAPLAPPTPAPTSAPAASGATSQGYETNIASMLNAKCTMCHKGAAAPKGLDLTSYDNLMKGGSDGPVIKAGDSAGSKLIEVQSKAHPANLSADELTLFKQWIDAGATGAAQAAPSAAAVTGSPTYDANIASILTTKCAICHKGTAAPKGLDLSSFASLMKGGSEGLVIKAGDAAGSKLIEVQSKAHPANLSADEMALFKQWIDAGAPEK